MKLAKLFFIVVFIFLPCSDVLAAEPNVKTDPKVKAEHCEKNTHTSQSHDCAKHCSEQPGNGSQVCAEQCATPGTQPNHDCQTHCADHGTTKAEHCASTTQDHDCAQHCAEAEKK